MPDRKVVFYKEGVPYEVYYQEASNWIALAIDKWFTISKTVPGETENSKIRESIDLSVREPLRRFVPGGPKVEHSVVNLVTSDKKIECNTGLAIQKAREMLEELSLQK